MAYSIVTHTGDGNTTTFPINFTLGFISRDYVKCRVGSEVDGLDQPIYRALTWITDGLVQVGGAPAALGVTIEFTRTVDKDQLIHDYSDGAAITESNLDDSNKQTLMALHEFLDDRIRVLPTSDLDMNSNKITNLADGTNPQDAVTVLQAGQAIALTPVAVQAAEDAAEALSSAQVALGLAQAAQAAAEAAAEDATIVLAGSLQKAQNLSDVQSLSTSRTNLDVYSKSEASTLFSLPTQTGNAGKFLNTNGSAPAWLDVLPAQAGNSGKFLTTNGTTPNWSTISTYGYGASVAQSSVQSLANGTWTRLDWNTEEFDDNAWHDNSTNPSRITVGETGRFLISGILQFDPAGQNATGVGIALYKNGVEVLRQFIPTGTYSTQIGCNLSVIRRATSGDYFELYAFQATGAARNTVVGMCLFQVSRYM